MLRSLNKEGLEVIIGSTTFFSNPKHALSPRSSELCHFVSNTPYNQSQRKPYIYMYIYIYMFIYIYVYIYIYIYIYMYIYIYIYDVYVYIYIYIYIYIYLYIYIYIYILLYIYTVKPLLSDRSREMSKVVFKRGGLLRRG